MASVNTIAGDIYTVEERAKIQGWLSSMWGISAIVGPALGGALAEYADWRWIFIINLPIGLLSMAFLFFFFKEKVIPRKPEIDYTGSILILLTIGLFIIYLLEGGQSWPWFGVEGVFILGTITALVFLTLKTENKAPEAILPSWIWKNKTLTFTNIAMFFMGITMMGPETFLPTFSQASLGLGIIVSGFVLASMSIGCPVSSALSGRLYLKIGFRNTSLIGTIMVAVACAGFLLIPWPQPVYLVIADQVLLGAGFGMLSTPALVGAQSLVGWEQRGVVTGMVIFCRNLGQSVGAAVFGAIFNNSFQSQMNTAPPEFIEKTENILEIIKNPAVSEAKKLFLQQAVNISTSHIYIGLVIFSILTMIAVYKMPVKGELKEETN